MMAKHPIYRHILVKDSFIERPALQRLPDFGFQLLHGIARSKSAGRGLKPLRMDDHVVQKVCDSSQQRFIRNTNPYAALRILFAVIGVVLDLCGKGMALIRRTAGHPAVRRQPDL